MDPIQSHPDGVDPLIGQVIDERYRIEELLGEGGIGRVYKARHATLGKLVALKVLLTRYESIPVLKQRFQREAEALAALSHPNIVTVTDYGVSGSMAYIVMELLEGEDLHHILARPEPIPPEQGMSIVRQMLRALAYAHEQGLVHRDLKPHNVFVRELGAGEVHVEVLDFGLARFVTDAYKDAPKLTAQGALLGTPAYMPPEQARGEDADARADVYAAACVLFETLTGRRVFESNDPGEILRSHMLSPPPALAQADPGLQVDPTLEAIVQRCLEKSPDARYDDAGQLLEALGELGPDAVTRVGPRPASTSPLSGVAATQAPKTAMTAAAKHRAQTAPAEASEVTLPQRRTPLLVAGGCAALLLMAVGAGAVWLLFGPGIQADVPPPPSGDATTPTPPPSQTPEPSSPLAAPAADPFAGDVPTLLQDIYRRIEDGDAVSRSQQLALTQFQAAHPGDPRPYVLHGHIHIDRESYEHGLREYQTAVEQDARVRGDPQMLPRVLLAVRHEETSEAAADFVVEAWGRGAAPAVQAATRERMPGEERARLEALGARLGGPDVQEVRAP